MKNINKSYQVYGIGLPRTGSTSLAEALNILGYSGKHFCSINNSSRVSSFKELEKYYIDNSSYLDLENIVRKNIGSKFIFTDRSLTDWSESIKKYDKNFTTNIVEYKEACISLFKKYNKLKDLLFINITENTSEKNWNILCSFLDKEIPNYKFPNVDQNK